MTPSQVPPNSLKPNLWQRLTQKLRRSPSSPGEQGELAAANFLKHNGYKIIAQNLKNRFGEIDLLAQAPDGQTIVIVEVKTRYKPHQVEPELRVGPQKQRKLAGLAVQIQRRYQLENQPLRFDIIGVDLIDPNTPPTIRHHIAAFESVY